MQVRCTLEEGNSTCDCFLIALPKIDQVSQAWVELVHHNLDIKWRSQLYHHFSSLFYSQTSLGVMKPIYSSGWRKEMHENKCMFELSLYK